jgi:hypothetical protein
VRTLCRQPLYVVVRFCMANFVPGCCIYEFLLPNGMKLGDETKDDLLEAGRTLLGQATLHKKAADRLKLLDLVLRRSASDPP